MQSPVPSPYSPWPLPPEATTWWPYSCHTTSELPVYKGLIANVGLSYAVFGTTRFSVNLGRSVQYSYDSNQPYYLQTGIQGSVAQQMLSERAASVIDRFERSVQLVPNTISGEETWELRPYQPGDNDLRRYANAAHARYSKKAFNGDEREFAEVYPLSMDQAWSEALGTPGAAPCQKDWQCVTTTMNIGEDASPGCDGEMHRSVSVTDSAGRS